MAMFYAKLSTRIKSCGLNAPDTLVLSHQEPVNCVWCPRKALRLVVNCDVKTTGAVVERDV